MLQTKPQFINGWNTDPVDQLIEAAVSTVDSRQEGSGFEAWVRKGEAIQIMDE